MLHDGKENIPFSKYPSLLELEDRHNVDIGPAYRTPDSAKTFTSFIATCQRNDFLGKLQCCHFYSILMDGTTDLGNKEEITAMVYCYKNDVGQEMTSCTRYWSVHSPEKCDANGLLVCLGASLELLGVKSILDRDSVLGVDGMPVLTDGASVNVAEHNGVRGQMKRVLPWIFGYGVSVIGWN